MQVRIYGLNNDGEPTSWSASSADSPQEYANRVLAGNPDRTLFAWVDDVENPPLVRHMGGDASFYEFCAKLIERGQHVGEAVATVDVLQDWADNAGLEIRAIKWVCSAAPVQAVQKAKPGQTQIVQEWVREIDHQVLVDRTWEATQAVAKGA